MSRYLVFSESCNLDLEMFEHIASVCIEKRVGPAIFIPFEINVHYQVGGAIRNCSRADTDFYMADRNLPMIYALFLH
jgi:hypothetical protein